MNFNYKLSFNKKKAFTLIELLIVIAIIGILFIVLVSKVDFATDKAKATGVQTDFRSFQMALEAVSKEKAGFNSFGWNTGDANANGVRDSVDEGDANEDGIYQDGETWTGHKKYLENWTEKYSLIKPGTTFDEAGYDKDAIFALETAINKNLDPKLHITIDAKTGLITMANGAQDPWNTQYHGAYISAEDGMDRGAIVMYSNGANQKFGSEHDIANGVPTVIVPGNNKNGADDYSIVVCYTYTNGYGEVGHLTTGFSNNQVFLTGNGNGGSEMNNDVNGGNNDDITDVDPINLAAGLYDSNNKQLASWSTLVHTYGLDVAKKYTATDYLTSTTSLYYIINNNLNLSTGTKLITGDDAKTISSYSLAGCDNLTDIVINDNVTSISKGALMDCNNLKTITTPFVSQDVGVTNGTYLGWFFGIENKELPNSLTTVIVTNTTAIGLSCFKGCTNLTNIVLPNSLTLIGAYAFEGCTGLATINIPNSVTTIQNRAFYESGIVNIVLPNNLTSLNSETFYNCKNLKSVTISSSLTKIGLDAFKNCENLNTVNITDLTSWLNIEFQNSYSQPMIYAKELLLNNQSITGDLVIPDDVTIIREYTLKGTKIESIVIHDNIESIKKGCLTECNNLQMITTPFIGQTFSNNTILGWFFDVNSSSTQNQFIPSSLTTVVITRATRIANRCFEGCANIKAIVIPDTVQTIDGYAFYNCSGITDIHIPEGVSDIGWDLFYGCKGLTMVKIPVSVTYLSEKAFAKSSISTIVFAGTMEQWNNIRKDSKWDTDSVLTTIQCSDGTIQLT